MPILAYKRGEPKDRGGVWATPKIRAEPGYSGCRV